VLFGGNLKVYISVDMEGVSGINHWDETIRNKPEYSFYKDELMNEIKAACVGANLSGAKEIWIKDAHADGRNIDFTGLPTNVKIIRSFNDHPYCMMQEIDESFDVAMMIGYHSYGCSEENPLSHTLASNLLSYIKINGIYASEFLINSYTASLVKVPVVFVSGDIGLCEHVKEINPNIKTVGLNKGIGASVISIHPQIAYDKIKQGVEDALKSNIDDCKIPLPKRFEVDLAFNHHTKAYKASFYPGMKKTSTTQLLYVNDDYFEVLRMFMFVLGFYNE